jgi:hypothetical protein
MDKLLTVFVISTQRGQNYNECIESLKSQNIKFNLIEIKDVSPMSSAFNKMIELCQTPYFIQIDEDMLLYKGAIVKLYNSIKTTTDNIAIVGYRLLDCHLNIKIGTIKIYKYPIIKNFPFQPGFACEQIQKEELQKSGYQIIIIEEIIAEHSPYWDTESIFKHYFNFGERYCAFGIIPQITENLNNMLLNDILFKDNTLNIRGNETLPLNISAFLGFLSGILYSSKMTKERDKYNYAKKEFEIISKYFNLKDITHNFGKK